MLKATEKIWHNGKLIPWDDARIHVLSHVVNYGSSVFEGVRCYAPAGRPAIFRLPEHMRRLADSAKIYRMEPLPFSRAELSQACLDVVAANGLASCYLRPLIVRGYSDLGVNGLKNPIESYVACWEWGKYLGEEALSHGVDVCVSSWSRMAPNTLPALAKAGGHYMNSQLIKMDAVLNGFTEGIALDTNGYVSEGSGENIFVIRDGCMHTPPLGTSVLPGITRDTVVTLARDLGISVVEGVIPREALYIADEVFFSGTAAEITPIRSIDHITIGTGRRGPITERLQHEFFDIVEGRKADRHNWFSYVEVRQPVVA